MEPKKQSSIALVVGIAALLVSGVAAYVRGDIPLIWQISAGVGIVGILAYFILARAAVGSALSSRTAKYSLNTIVMSLAMLGTLVLVNMMSGEYDAKVDVTKNKLHTLSEQTVKVLKGLTSEITLKAFISPQQMQEFEQLFAKYSAHTKMLKKEYIDVDKDPFAVQKYQIKSAGTLVVESPTRSARVENLYNGEDPKLEEKVTNAIIQVAKGTKRKIYFLTGHGEHLVSDNGRDGYSEIKDTLSNGRYDVQELLLVDKDKVPADADIVVIAGPRSEMLDREVKMLENYVNDGGKVLAMVDPTSSSSVHGFLTKYGVEWQPKKTVFEANRLQQLANGNPLTPIITTYTATHPITQEAKQMSIFPVPSPVSKAANAPFTVTVESLFSTSPRSIEAEITGDKVKVDEKAGKKGPLSLAVAVVGKVEEKKDDKKPAPTNPEEAAKAGKEFRLVVVGNSAFATNGVIKFGINSDIFQNMLSWLSKEEDLISIRPKSTEAGEFQITEVRARVINLASVVLAPFAMFLSGILVWLFRRRL